MQQLALLIDDHLDWIARSLVQSANTTHSQSDGTMPTAARPTTEPADLDLAQAIQRLVYLILARRGDCTPVLETPTLPDHPDMAREADRIVDLGRELGLSGLLRTAKEVRRRVLELVLWSDLEPERQTCERRAAIAAYDQLELLLAQAWERDEQAHAVTLGEAMVLQAMHYPVLIVDMAERIRWMNEAAMTLWHALPSGGPDEPRPIYLDSMVPDLTLPWDSFVNQDQGWASRASFEQEIVTHGGMRHFTISVWPLPAAAGATPTIALFLLDCTS